MVELGYTSPDRQNRTTLATNPSRQRLFLSVLPTTLARLLLRSQAERKALRSYPTGQVRRKEKGCPYISNVKLHLTEYYWAIASVTPTFRWPLDYTLLI